MVPARLEIAKAVKADRHDQNWEINCSANSIGLNNSDGEERSGNALSGLFGNDSLEKGLFKSRSSSKSHFTAWEPRDVLGSWQNR